MLPPGHIAAGYLLAKYLTVNQPILNVDQQSWLAVLGGFFAFAPDLDMFYAFIKERGFHHTGAKFNHREFITHTPVFWLILSVLVALIGQAIFWYYIALVILVGAWSHLILDSTFFGVRWLYPFSNKFYAIKMAGEIEINTATGFFNHWINLIKMYYRAAPLTFLSEIILVIVALITFFNN